MKAASAPSAIDTTPFEKAVAAECERRLFHLRKRGLAVACSGGPDSTALLHVLARQSRQLGFRLVCLHVDHGLQAASAAWAEMVVARAQALGVEVAARRVDVADIRPLGVEAAAREARYAALNEMCAALRVSVLALGHHALDQAETLLMRLIRGAGPRGLAAMRDWREDASGITRWRPMLACHPSAIVDHLRHFDLASVDDPTNDSDDYLRNALRHRVLTPLLDIAPQALDTIGRSARLLAAASDSLSGRARVDLAACLAGQQTAEAFPELAGALKAPTLDLARLRGLDASRRNLVLQEWLMSTGCEPPSEAWLEEVWRQAARAGDDADLDLRWQGRQWSRHRGRLDCLLVAPPVDGARSFVWRGESEWQPAGWPGRFLFENAAGRGIAGERLRGAALVAVARRGGEQLAIDPRRPTRSLKHWYQSFGLPPVLRRRAPLLWLGDDLLHVPGVGSAHGLITEGADVWNIRWQAD